MLGRFAGADKARHSRVMHPMTRKGWVGRVDRVHRGSVDGGAYERYMGSALCSCIWMEKVSYDLPPPATSRQEETAVQLTPHADLLPPVSLVATVHSPHTVHLCASKAPNVVQEGVCTAYPA